MEEEIITKFTDEQEALVRESWETLQQNIQEHSIYFFTLILRIAPSAKGLFSYLKDTDELPQDNPHLRAHAIGVFKRICESAANLRDNGRPVDSGTEVESIASIHLERGVLKNHFPIMRAALLRTVKEAVGEEKWSDEMEEAWRVAYDELSGAILVRMQKLEEEKAEKAKAEEENAEEEEAEEAKAEEENAEEEKAEEAKAEEENAAVEKAEEAKAEEENTEEEKAAKVEEAAAEEDS